MIESKRNLLFITIVSLSAVLITLFFWAMLPPAFKVDSGDYTCFYEPVARNILKGNGPMIMQGDTAFISFPPGYPLILAGIFSFSKVFNIPENIFLWLFILISIVLTSLFIFSMAKMAWGVYPALICSLIWMTYPFYLNLTKQPNSEIAFILVFYGSISLLLRTVFNKIHAWYIYVLIGALIGLTMLIRPIAIGLGMIVALTLFFLESGIRLRLRFMLILALLLGNILVVLPWEMWVYQKTGKIIPLSVHGSDCIKDGLTFNGGKDYRRSISLPADVEKLMQNIRKNYRELDSSKKIAFFMVDAYKAQPLAVIKLVLIKMARSWYATDSQRFETQILFIQLPYLILILFGTFAAWKQGGVLKRMAVVLWFIALYFWLMTFLALSVLRYMVPPIGLLFILIPALFSKSTLLNSGGLSKHNGHNEVAKK
ncbi:MAG: glycosyltransferase family 39 protein [Candidatus Omnitrophica bacterium]|nr:glycosyltransferase family 39 protein [Candidatus Omnitrophota bacterium]